MTSESLTREVVDFVSSFDSVPHLKMIAIILSQMILKAYDDPTLVSGNYAEDLVRLNSSMEQMTEGMGASRYLVAFLHEGGPYREQVDDMFKALYAAIEGKQAEMAPQEPDPQ